MWASDYLQMKVAINLRPGDWAAQGANLFDRATGATVGLPGVKHKLPAGMLALGAGGALVGLMGHRAGHTDVRKKLLESGSTPEEIARADYLAKGPKQGYGAGGAMRAGLAGMGAGIGTNLLLQKATGMNPAMARGLGLVAGLGAAHATARSHAEGNERRRMKGMDY